MRITKEIYMVADGGRGLSHELDCCVYLVDCAGKIVMIDSGVGLDNETIVNNIVQEGINPEKIEFLFLTHCHGDHVGGAKLFQKEYSIEVIAPDIDAQLIESGSDEELGLNISRGTIYPPDYQYNHCKIDRILNDGESIKIGDKVFTLIQVPGHSQGSSCILVEGDKKILFSGDVVFHGGTIGLGNWPGSSLEQYRKNINKLGGLGVEQLFPGHFLFTLRDGQRHLDTAINNLKSPWVPPAWLHNHPHY